MQAKVGKKGADGGYMSKGIVTRIDDTTVSLFIRSFVRSIVRSSV